MRCTFVAFLLLCSLTANAQDQAATFPADTVALIDRELPHMDKAVAEKDRAWFGPALERAQAVLALWEKRQGPKAQRNIDQCRALAAARTSAK